MKKIIRIVGVSATLLTVTAAQTAAAIPAHTQTAAPAPAPAPASMAPARTAAAQTLSGNSVYTEKFDDARGVFFTEEAFGIKADGKHDVSDALQEAVNQIKNERAFGTLYLPEGKYRISRTIYVPAAIRIVGYGKTRPEIVLAKNTPGFSEEKTSMIWFTGGVVRDPENVQDGNAGTFYSGISNVNIRIEKGNPMAIGLRTHVAQHGVFSHISIYGGDAYACLYDVGNEMEDVQFFGASYGIDSKTTAPSWPMAIVDVVFDGQKEAAIRSENAGLAIVNMKVRNTPVGIICDSGMADRLFVEDSYFENVQKAVVVTGDENANNETNLLNIYCRNVPVFAELQKRGASYTMADKSYKVNEFVYGLMTMEMGDDSEYGVIFKNEPAAFPTEFARTVPATPDMSTWVSVARYGATGDGETDDTDAIQKAIDENETVFFPEGWYRISRTIKLRKGSRVIGLHPFSTQLVLAESTPAFSGFGSPVPMVESSKGGDDIVTGIGICTGGYNSRAVGMKWLAGEKSLLNDVKFVGGHGTMNKPAPRPEGQASQMPQTPTAGQAAQSPQGPTAGQRPQMPQMPMGGFFGMMRVSSPSNPVAAQGLDQAWDNQYWSLWITDGGGGTIKDIWTANSYASCGLYVSNTRTPTRMYAISLEHHVRFESRWRNVENFKVYAMQYEEESREGRDAVAMTMDNCRNIMFANLWFYRVIRVMAPRDYGTLVSNCENIEFRNVKNWTQVQAETCATAYDMNKNVSTWPLAFAYGRITGSEKSRRPDGALYEPVKIGRGYQFLTGTARDSKGNIYFCEGALRKVYKWDAASGAVTLVSDLNYRPISLAVDTEDHLIVVCRYTAQPGFRDGQLKPIQNYADANENYSGWGNGMWSVVLYAIDTKSEHDTMIPLKTVPTASVKPQRVIHPSHSLRSGDFFDIYDGKMPEESWLAPDGVTIIPDRFDICRAMEMTAVTPGQKTPVHIAWEDPKTTYRFNVNSDGSLSLADSPAVKRGEYGMAYGDDGKLYLAEGQIFVYGADGKELRRIEVEERPLSIEIGGQKNEYLLVTTNNSLYRIRVK